MRCQESGKSDNETCPPALKLEAEDHRRSFVRSAGEKDEACPSSTKRKSREG